jgi:hypothetical protein
MSVRTGLHENLNRLLATSLVIYMFYVDLSTQRPHWERIIGWPFIAVGFYSLVRYSWLISKLRWVYFCAGWMHMGFAFVIADNVLLGSWGMSYRRPEAVLIPFLFFASPMIYVLKKSRETSNSVEWVDIL